MTNEYDRFYFIHSDRRAHIGHHVFCCEKTSSASDFYTAGGGLTGFQNGLAIAGDYMSAASFLGIAGMIALNGFDGFSIVLVFL